MEKPVHWIKNKHDLSLFFVSFTYLFSSFRLFSRAAFSISNRRWSLRSRNICFSTYLKKKETDKYNLKVTINNIQPCEFLIFLDWVHSLFEFWFGHTNSCRTKWKLTFLLWLFDSFYNLTTIADPWYFWKGICVSKAHKPVTLSGNATFTKV